MKILVVNPPLGSFLRVYASVPILVGQLVNNNIEAAALDMNIEFLKEITGSGYLKYTKELLEKIYKDNKLLNEGVTSKYQLNDVQLSELNKTIELCFTSYRKVINYFINGEKCFYDEYMYAVHKKLLNDTQNFAKYAKILSFLISFAFLPFYPEKNCLNTMGIDTVPITSDPLHKYVYEDIMDKCTNRLRNIYIKIFEKKVQELNLNQYDVIAITVPFEQNIYPAFTLGKIIKEKTRAKVVIGGIVPTTTTEGYMKYPDMFGTLFDNILTGDGEKSIVQYVQYLENKINISDVSGMLYKENNTVIKNKIIPILNINEVYPPDYTGINFSDYIVPKNIGIEFAKGCYYHKCIFCYNNLWKKYYIKTPENAADMIKNLNEKYGINDFEILDDALNINFAKAFANEIIKRKLDIKYTCFLRIEENLTFDVLKNLKKSGCSGIFFGIESASERILCLMNKGINLETAKRILKDCHKLGIEITAAFMYGFPTEEKEDIFKTIKFIKENNKYISSVTNAIFHITKSSAMLTSENKKKFKITNVEQPEEFSEDIKYNAPGISRKEICKILKENDFIYSMFTKWNEANEL